MQCLGQQEGLPAAENAMLMHACMVECAVQAAPAIHRLLTPLGQPAADHTPEAPSSPQHGRGAGPAPHRISKLAFTSLYTEHLTPLT
eukprot:335015-Pelagomonas_calceolata.AAC.1